MQKVKIGIIGCGNISGNYIQNYRKFEILELAACADLDLSRAQALAEKSGSGAKACSVEELLADKSIQIVVNLTVPQAHTQVALQAIAAGKHVYSEKPLALTREEGKQILAAAKRKKVRVGCAPDTFLGAGIQTCRKLIDDGAIGQIVAGTAFMLCAGHESWHPAPEFYYKLGGGPMFDMGPYYLTALLNLIGPMQRISGFSRITRPQRTITSQPLNGKVIDVETPDHVAGTIEFAGGAIVNVAMSFAVHGNPHPPITLFGTKGALAVPDPNGFDGAVRVRYAGTKEWQDVPFTHPTGYGRSFGVADMAHAIVGKRPHRASGEQAFAVLDAMQGFLDASDKGKAYVIKAPYQRAAALPTTLAPGLLD
ncbi:MAG: Gfo/Idh/MocA family oxidoreductase [Phycisphaeraceae bacterium]|nr:Gfo/Idh/MocA family oxidoreductase [Phycisphaeraceae bacterium]